ncbi:prenyltransferase [Neomicrococcus lactis]|uniref:Lycopene cyclase domain-containing protein n=1 Tax=Neomicrococcus lactis TaxID=732241 RepID=A0A7W8YBC3_9MICC|nr:lycopene cyclase domain-containing protein [Neomicrococcus lactis]
MRYALLSVAFLAIAVTVALILTRAGSSLRVKVNMPAVLVAGTALMVLTAVFDTLMIALNLFTYSDALISGIRVGLAPVEDFAYPLATVILLPALWQFMTHHPHLKMSALLKHALIVSRPVSWINTAFPFGAAYFLATRDIDWLLVVGAIYYLIPYNLAMYGINDVFDYASDINNPRKGGLEGALLPPAYHRPMLWLCLVTNVPFLAVLFAAGSPESAIALAVSTFAVIAYSAAGLRFKERPFVDSLTSSTHFVSPAVVGLTLAGASFDSALLLMLGAFFCWGIAAHAFGAVQDIQPDREAGIGSVATVIGARSTVIFTIVMWGTAGILMLMTSWPGPLVAIVAVPYIVNAVPYLHVTDQDAGTTNKAWRRFIWLNYFSGFLVTLTMILWWMTVRG